MRIVDFDDFVKLPPGTVFSFYEPYVCTGLHILRGVITHEGETKASDFFYISLIATCWNGDPPTCECAIERDGCFDYNRQFAVYEAADLYNIRETLGW